MKLCLGCNQEKPSDDYYPRKNRSSGLESRCKDCYKIYKTEYRKNNKEIIRAQNKRRVPGWDIDRYNSQLESQGNVCAICGDSEPASRDWCQDHDHETNEPRGLLCNRCNAGLGYFRDNPEYLQSAIEYLNKWQVATSHVTPQIERLNYAGKITVQPKRLLIHSNCKFFHQLDMKQVLPRYMYLS